MLAGIFGYYTPLKLQGSKTQAVISRSSCEYYTPVKLQGSKTELVNAYFLARYYTPVKLQGSKTCPTVVNMLD